MTISKETPLLPVTSEIRLPELFAARLRGGLDRLTFEELPECQSMAAGELLWFLDDGNESIALGVVDPDNQCIWSWPVMGKEGQPKIDAGFVRRRIERALQWRKRLGLVDADSAYRLINGAGDGLAGYAVEVYARHVVIYCYSSQLAQLTQLVATALMQTLPLASVISKVRPPGETPVGRVEYVLHSDEPPPKAVITVESGIKYEVHLQGGINTGLFCDMRDLRATLSALVPNRRVLNLFAYTGSFSVVAALSDAKLVTTVEFAAGVVEWCKTNFELNGLSTNTKTSRFVKGDVFEFLKTARRHGDQWDVIIVDPPGTTAVPGRKWRLKSDYHRLIASALQVLSSGGILVVAANTHQSRPDGIEKHIREAAKNTGRRLRLIDSLGLPADFPTQMIQPEHRYLKVYLLLAE